MGEKGQQWGQNMMEVHCRHVWKCHNRTPLKMWQESFKGDKGKRIRNVIQ
jgi:hypothetical protein